jgi:hypothetical protein
MTQETTGKNNGRVKQYSRRKVTVPDPFVSAHGNLNGNTPYPTGKKPKTIGPDKELYSFLQEPHWNYNVPPTEQQKKQAVSKMTSKDPFLFYISSESHKYLINQVKSR